MTSAERLAIQSEDELKSTVARIVELSRDDAKILLEANENIAAIEADRDRRREPILEELNPLVEKVWDHVEKHPELFAKASEVRFPGAVLSRVRSTRLEIPDMELLIKALRRLGEGAIIRIEESVAKNAIKQKKGLIDRLRTVATDAVRELPMWNFSLSFLPRDTASEKGGVPPTLKHDSPVNDED